MSNQLKVQQELILSSAFWTFVQSVAPESFDLAEHDQLVEALGLPYLVAERIRCAASAATADAVKAGFVAGWLACKEPERLIFATPEEDASIFKR